MVENENVGTTVSLPSMRQQTSLTAGVEFTWLTQQSGSAALLSSAQQSACAGGKTARREKIKASKSLTINLSVTQLESVEIVFLPVTDTFTLSRLIWSQEPLAGSCFGFQNVKGFSLWLAKFGL